MAKGKIKTIKNDPGTASNNQIIMTDNKTGLDIAFTIPVDAAAMNLNVGDEVRYDTVPGTTNQIAYVERICSGTVAAVGADNGSGVISEKLTGKQINFYQPFLKELGIKIGTAVKYNLVSASFAQSSALTAATATTSATSTASAGTVSVSGIASDDLAIVVRIDPNP
ncbi:MAG: hypothetical protein NT084_13035 [Bacteroidetes bacterium]|nr:hypothetical protein [Bacteroidota bacterium]